MSSKPKQKKKIDQTEKDRRFYRRAWRILAGFFRFILHLKASGTENIPAEGGCLLCINHIAAIDPIAVGAVCTRQPRFLAKKELFNIPVLGWLIRRLGATPLDRGGSDVSAIRKTVSLATDGEMVAIFPQGHRYAGKNPADTPVRNGAAMIAYRAGVPVLPVCIKTKKHKYAMFRRVDIIFGKPIPYEDLFQGKEGTTAAYAAATDRIFSEICALGGFVPTKGEKQP